MNAELLPVGADSRAGPTSPAAAAAWENALDLFFESWRISEGWGPVATLSFRRKALNLSRLVGVAALARSRAVIEIHLSSARRDLAELEGELDRSLSLYGKSARFEAWVGWSTRLGESLSRWRQEAVLAVK